jgi:hypothetical protein
VCRACICSVAYDCFIYGDLINRGEEDRESSVATREIVAASITCHDSEFAICIRLVHTTWSHNSTGVSATSSLLSSSYNHILSVMPHCLSTVTCLPLIGRIRRHPPLYDPENAAGHVPSLVIYFQILSSLNRLRSTVISSPRTSASSSRESQLRMYASSPTMFVDL